MIVYTPIELYDMGFGPRMIPVTPPGVDISPSSGLHPKSLGKAPGKPTSTGWTGVDLNDPKYRCLDYGTAKHWLEDWGANIGFVAGDGYAVLDNDQGKEFSEFLRAGFERIGVDPLRRYVLDPKHERDAYFFRVLNFVGEGALLANRDLTFRNGVASAKIQLLAQGKQAVISGTHSGTRSPYVWDRKIETLDDIPVLSEEQFREFLEGVVRRLNSAGWKFEGSLASLVSPVSPVPPVPARVAIATQPVTNVMQLVADAKDLLDLIPNRDVPPGTASNKIDQWLDDYANWISVAYALAAQLGSAAGTPEAETLWLQWSDGRTQIRQDSLSLWKSALRQQPRYGPLGLFKLVQAMGALPPAGFPALAPDDPALVPLSTPIWDALRERWAFFRPTGGFLDIVTDSIIPKQAFADEHASQARVLLAELWPHHDKRRKPPTAADLVVKQPSLRCVDKRTYAPGDKWPLLPHEKDPKLWISNKWRPTNVPAIPVSPDQVKPWLEHVEFVLGSPSERDRFVRWCAFVAQCPERKPNWHYLIMSLQGIGKDTMIEPLKAAVGKDNWKEETTHQLTYTHNILETKLLILSETGQPRSGHTTAHDVQNYLKPVLSNPPATIQINQKNQPVYTIPNRIAGILFSNESNPLLLERNQRRIHVINCRNLKPKLQSYYDGLWNWLDKGGGTNLTASYLLSLPLTSAQIAEFTGVAPESVAKTELEQLSVHPALDELEELITTARAGTGPFVHLLAEANQLAEHIGARVHKPTPQMVRGWLLDMEHRKEGVHRLRIDPRFPHLCGIVSVKGFGSAKLWALDHKTADGRDWGQLSNAEILALWQGKPAPPRASVTPFPIAPTVPIVEDERI